MIAYLTQLRQSFLRAFYASLLWLTRREIVIARSTGRNPSNILALRQDEDEYERALCRLELGIRPRVSGLLTRWFSWSSTTQTGRWSTS